jgi:hypothetical protein
MKRALALVLLAAFGAAGCGDSSEGGEGASDRLVDFSKKPPFVNSLERVEQSGEFLVTTNRGFFRIDPESGMPLEERRRPSVVPEPPSSTMHAVHQEAQEASGWRRTMSSAAVAADVGPVLS